VSEGFDTASMARMVRSMPPEQLAEGLRLNREAILGEVFRRFSDQLSPAGRRQEAVIKWKIGEGSGRGGYDRWFVVLRDGRCESGLDLDLRPRVTFTVGPLDFLRLVTGNADPTRLWLRRRLGIRGDLRFAARMPSFFTRPTGA
jgi:SCP-2 sterol transfer family